MGVFFVVLDVFHNYWENIEVLEVNLFMLMRIDHFLGEFIIGWEKLGVHGVNSQVHGANFFIMPLKYFFFCPCLTSFGWFV